MTMTSRRERKRKMRRNPSSLLLVDSAKDASAKHVKSAKPAQAIRRNGAFIGSALISEGHQRREKPLATGKE